MGGKGERWGTMSHEKGCVQNKRDDCPPSGMVERRWLLTGAGSQIFQGNKEEKHPTLVTVLNSVVSLQGQ